MSLYSRTSSCTLLGNSLRSSRVFLPMSVQCFVLSNVRSIVDYKGIGLSLVISSRMKKNIVVHACSGQKPNCSTFVRPSRVIERHPFRVFHVSLLPSTHFNGSATSSHLFKNLDASSPPSRLGDLVQRTCCSCSIVYCFPYLFSVVQPFSHQFKYSSRMVSKHKALSKSPYTPFLFRVDPS